MPDDYYLATRWSRKYLGVKSKYNWMFSLTRPHLVECYNRVKKIMHTYINIKTHE